MDPASRPELEPELPQPEYAEPPPAGGFGVLPSGALAPAPSPAFGFLPFQGFRPQELSPVVVGLLPPLIGWLLPNVLQVAAALLDLYPIMFVGTLVQWACVIWFFANAFRALDDLRKAVNEPDFARWPVFIPIFNVIYFLTSVTSRVERAKELRGMPRTRSGFLLYLFFPLYGLQRDLNELAKVEVR